MSCSVAVSNSPVFSPSSSLFCNKTSILTSPEALTLTLAHLKPSQASSSSTSTPSSPSSPFRLRIPKPPTGLSGSGPGPGSSSPSTVLKRKRPARLDIPVASWSSGAAPATPSLATWRELVEVEDDGYSVYCKRGRREAMEDRYSAAINLQGDPKQVMQFFFFKRKKKIVFEVFFFWLINYPFHVLLVLTLKS